MQIKLEQLKPSLFVKQFNMINDNEMLKTTTSRRRKGFLQVKLAKLLVSKLFTYNV